MYFGNDGLKPKPHLKIYNFTWVTRLLEALWVKGLTYLCLWHYNQGHFFIQLEISN